MRAIILLGICALVLGACGMKPIPRSDLSDDKVDGVRKSLDAFRKMEKLEPFFAEAEVIAVYPWSARGANGVGIAYGSGLVFDKAEEPIGYTRMYQITAGPQVGAQVYRQILFFRTRQVYTDFTRSPGEFAELLAQELAPQTQRMRRRPPPGRPAPGRRRRPPRRRGPPL